MMIRRPRVVQHAVTLSKCSASRKHQTGAQITGDVASCRRRGVAPLEEIMVLAIMVPLAFGILTFCWNVSGMMYQIIRGFVLTPVL